MEPKELVEGDIVQLSLDCKNQMFAGCLMVVTEPKSFGVQGYVQLLGSDGKPGGQAYIRVSFDEMEPTNGVVSWLVK